MYKKKLLLCIVVLLFVKNCKNLKYNQYHVKLKLVVMKLEFESAIHDIISAEYKLSHLVLPNDVKPRLSGLIEDLFKIYNQL